MKQKLINHLNQLYPQSLCQAYDKVGLEVNFDVPISGVIITLELSKTVILEAIEQKCNFIICHHPFFFTPLTNLDTTTTKGELIELLILNQISVFSIHTNADAAQNGLGDLFAKKLNIDKQQPLIYVNETEGLGGFGTLKQTISFDDYCQFIKTTFEIDYLRISGQPKSISSVAYINGSGASSWPLAKALNADVFITGDVTYHYAQDALQSDLLIIELPHYCEIIFCEMISKALIDFKGLIVVTSKGLKNPFTYY